MNNPWLELWETRYSKKEYAFGTDPNVFLKEKLEQLTPGTILFPAEGEGRNAVYAAKLGWKVYAFDISAEGKKKALYLAKANQVTLDYQVGELPYLQYDEEQFDVIASIYAHFPINIRSQYHKLLSKYLRKGGLLILEGFDKKHFDYRLKNPNVGGPTNMEGLFSVEELKSDFANFEIIELVEKEVNLKEGIYHEGIGHVVRFVAKKKLKSSQ